MTDLAKQMVLFVYFICLFYALLWSLTTSIRKLIVSLMMPAKTLVIYSWRSV